MMIDVTGSNAYYYHQDANGNVICMTNSSQEIVEGYSYDAFGQCTVNTTKGTDGCWLTPDGSTQSYSNIGNPYLFTARRLDTETGLYYNRFRMYDAYIGRFCQPDPISYAGGINLYAYVGNNPLNWIDPWGLDGVGLGFSGTLGAIFGGTDGAQLVIDDDGNIGLYIHYGGGGFCGAGISTMIDATAFTGTIIDLQGTFVSSGFSVGEGLGVGLEGSFSDTSYAVTVSGGFDFGLPFEVHGFREKGEVIPLLSIPSREELVDAYKDAYSDVKKWTKDKYEWAKDQVEKNQERTKRNMKDLAKWFLKKITKCK